jgi:hypothetical protein
LHAALTIKIKYWFTLSEYNVRVSTVSSKYKRSSLLIGLVPTRHHYYYIDNTRLI